MTIYRCDRCLKEFGQKSHYTKHINKKNKCPSNAVNICGLTDIQQCSKYQCERCLKEFGQKSHYTVHQSKKIPCADNRERFANIARMKKSSHLQFVDLFAGTGAFSLVMEELGPKCVFANDSIPASRHIYELNHGTTGNIFHLGDINDIPTDDIPNHDILCGGFPCQPFSIAGKQNGFDDERSDSFWKVIEILEHRQPRVVVLENVKNIITHDDGNSFSKIIRALERVGYTVITGLVNTRTITELPQNRERVYFICFINKEDSAKFSFDFPEVEQRAITEFLEPHPSRKYYYNTEHASYDAMKNFIETDVDNAPLYSSNVSGYIKHMNYCPTLTASMRSGFPFIQDIHGIRKITPRECFNLQGFPADYKLPLLGDKGVYSLAGNAVSIPVIRLIMNRLIQIICE